ncbi:MAG: PAS domain S-box protein, partial [bacterium]
MKVNEKNKNYSNLKNQTRTPHTILVVEDDKSFAALIYKKLQQEGYHTEWASTGSEALSWLTENPCTLMLLDYQLPDMTGQQVIYSITEQRRNVPFILMTAHGNEKLAVKMMKLGARDYLVKDQGFRNLLPVITKQVIEQLETEKKLTEAEDALKRSEEKYRMLIENMPDGIYRSTPCGKFIEVNHALIKMLGYDSYEEVMNLNIPQDLYFAPAEREKALALLQHEECPKTTILRLKKKDGSELWVEDHGRIVYDQNGKKLYYEGVLRDITVRKKVEDALRESEMRFRAVTQSANEAIISSNSHGNIITWNLGAQTIFGYREEEVLGKPLTLLMPDRYHEAHRKGMERVLSTGEKNVIGKTIELPGLRKDGTEFPMEVSLAAWETEEGTFYSGILRDITERKRTTEVLKESEEKFRGLAEHSPNMIFINRKGRIIYANKTCEEMMGYTREEFHDPDFDFFTLIAPESKDIIKENFCRHLKGEEIPPYEYTLITKDGKRLNAINTTKLINYEGAKGILGIITDITERKQAEEALRKAEEKYRSIFENVHEGIYQSTPDGHALTANPRLAQIFGYNSPEELIADVTNIGEQFYVDPERNKEFKRLMKKQGSVFGFESQMYRKDGSIAWISENARTICDASGKVLIYEGTMEDITERKLAEEELRKSEARLAEAQRIANLGSWEWDVKNNKLLWSDETYRIFGLRPNEFGAT